MEENDRWINRTLVERSRLKSESNALRGIENELDQTLRCMGCGPLWVRCFPTKQVALERGQGNYQHKRIEHHTDRNALKISV
eukprot:3724121-Amphidinium_carterae.1